MEAYINMISNFDARNDYKVTYTFLGSQRIITNEMSIRESTKNGKVVYTRKSTKFDKDHTIPKDSLVNGKSYLAKIRVQLGDEWSDWSPEVPFTCLRTPSIVFKSLDEKNYIYNDDIMMEAVYRQEQGERVESFQFILMDSNKVPLTKYPVRHPDHMTPNILKERIQGLVKGRLYYIGCKIKTVNGINYMEIHEFVPHYVAPSLDGIMQTQNQPESGQVLVQAYLKQLLGTQTKPFVPNATNDNPENFTFLNSEWVVIPPDMPLYYTRLGMAKTSDWIAKIWCKNVVDGVMLDFSKEKGDGVHIKFIKHRDYITAEKEYNGIVSRTKSNTIPNLGLGAFYMFIKVIEYRIEIKIAPMDKMEIVHNFLKGGVGRNSKVLNGLSREVLDPGKMKEIDQSQMTGIKAIGDERYAKTTSSTLNDRAQMAIEYDVIDILEASLSDSIWGGKTSIIDKVKIARRIFTGFTATVTGRGGSTNDNILSMRVWDGSKWIGEKTRNSANYGKLSLDNITNNSIITDNGKIYVGLIANPYTTGGVSEVSLDYAESTLKINTNKI